jgi:hypothetical protein
MSNAEPGAAVDEINFDEPDCDNYSVVYEGNCREQVPMLQKWAQSPGREGNIPLGHYNIP